MKNAQIAVVVLLCFAAVGLTGCSCGTLCLNPRDAQALAKPGQKVPRRTISAGPDNFRWPEGKRAAISLSFDDARLSQVDRGLPILDAYGVKATFYVVPSRVEQRLSGWKKAVADGHEIGNHTLKHPCTGNFPWSREKALEEYSLEDAERELDEASAAIERLLGVRAATFAYPCGQKFVGRGLSVKSYVPLVAGRFVVGRGAFDEVANDPAFCDLAQVMGIDLDGLDFKQIRQLVDVAVADGRWLVLFGHEVGEAGHQTTFASTLEALCRYAQDPANGLWIDTVAAVGQYILEQRAKIRNQGSGVWSLARHTNGGQAFSGIGNRESNHESRTTNPDSRFTDVLRAGTAKIDITPQKSVRMSGYDSRTELSTGVHDPLSARVVAFENNGKRFVLVSSDLIGFYDGTAEHFRKVILSEFELEPSELFLSAIHTHAGPELTIDKEKGHPHNLEYTESLEAKLIEVIRKALNNMGTVRIGAGIGYCPIGSNRRELTFDSVGDSSIKLGQNPYGPTDKEVLVVKMAKPDGTVVAVLFDYAIHATCLTGKNYIISGDVLGLAEQFVEKILARQTGGGLGQEVIAPAFTGASGNINPWLRVLPEFDAGPDWIPEPVLLGTVLGEEVVHVFRDIGKVSGGPATARAFAETSGEINPPDERRIKTAFTTLELPGKPRNQVTMEKDCPATALNITAARVGDIAFVGIGCEVLTEIGMSIKAASPYKHTFVITHCNGAAGYLAPEHLYIEGGYEIKSSPFAPQAADIVVKQAVKMLHEL